MSEGDTGPRVIIIGAGVGGLSFAIALKRQLGFQNFTIFEKAQSVGGTWRDNKYPGCSSDISVQFYSLSTDLKSDWSCTHPFQPELETYWDELSHKYDLYPHIHFGCSVITATWDPSSHLYHVTIEDVATGERTTADAEVLISAIGLLEVPRFPDISGLSKFKGHLFHSARWSPVDLSGKRVAVIGNGASATQFVPIISKTPNIQVTQFCRTPNWILPPIRSWYSPWSKLAFKYLPLYQRFSRFKQYLKSDINYVAIFKYGPTRRIASSVLRKYIKWNTPSKYHQQLIPNYALGCKRVIFNTDYLSTLHQDNVNLNWDGVSSFVGDGIMTLKGEHLTFDTIILATGYAADAYPLVVHGTKEQTIQEYFERQGGPTAYLGTCVPGFPNFYVIGGPNTATGHTSVLFTEEVQNDYVIQLIKPILERRIVSIDVTAAATDQYNAKIQARLSRSVFVQCFSWYRKDGTGKVTNIFPGSGALFWWWLRRPDWKHYNVVGRWGEEWKAGGGHTSKWAVTLALVAVAYTYSLWLQ